jgi:hypothetical protein
MYIMDYMIHIMMLNQEYEVPNISQGRFHFAANLARVCDAPSGLMSFKSRYSIQQLNIWRFFTSIPSMVPGNSLDPSGPPCRTM